MTAGKRSILAAIGVLAIATGVVSCVPIWEYQELEGRIADLEEQIQGQRAGMPADTAGISAVQGEVEQLRDDLDGISRRLDRLRADFEACRCGATALGLPVYFPENDATIREEDKPVLDRLAAALASAYPDAVLTVEGFANPDSTAAFTRRLSQLRADAVRDYLVEQAGLPADQVRAVGYGAVEYRQVDPGTGDRAAAVANRRVSFVIDWAGRVGTPEGARDDGGSGG